MESLYCQGMDGLIDNYQGYFIDVWGVIHDGAKVCPGSIEVLEKLQHCGKKVVLLSNAPRRSWAVEDLLNGMGVTKSHYNHLVTSGEDAWASIQEDVYVIPEIKKGAAYFIGMDQDLHMLHESGIMRTENMAEASFILATGMPNLGESLAQYKDTLDEGVERNLPFVCVNPDMVVHIKGEEFLCAGTLAHYYESRGGKVFYHGKPHRSVYERAHALMGHTPKDKILAIGDSLHTDVKGARGFGIDVAFIMGGIHKKEMLDNSHLEREDLESKLSAMGEPPTYHMPSFAL